MGSMYSKLTRCSGAAPGGGSTNTAARSDRVKELEDVAWSTSLGHPAQLPGRSLFPAYKDRICPGGRKSVSNLVEQLRISWFPVGGGDTLKIPDQEGVTMQAPKPRNTTEEARPAEWGLDLLFRTPISKTQFPSSFRS